MNGQMNDDPDAPSTMERRIGDIVTQPFIRPLVHYEANYTDTHGAQRDVIAWYDASPISGIH